MTSGGMEAAAVGPAAGAYKAKPIRTDCCKQSHVQKTEQTVNGTASHERCAASLIVCNLARQQSDDDPGRCTISC